MGGAGVAVADSANAVHFNPAMLAVYDQYKDDSGNSRFVVPTLAVQWSDTVANLVDLQSSGIVDNLVANIDRYNAAPGASTASSVAASAGGLSQALIDAASDGLFFDANGAVVVGIPSLRQGGAFYVNGRTVAGGQVTFSGVDRQLLQQYIDGLTFIATSGAFGTPAPELFDAQNQLLDQTGELNSSARVTGWLVGEAGVAIADESELFARTLYWGLTPKVQGMSSIDEEENAARGTVKMERDASYRFRTNLDAGVAIDLRSDLRAGMVIKNLFPTRLETQLGRVVEFEPQWRAGLGWHRPRLTLAVDLDLMPNQGFGGDADSQQFAAGGEFTILGWLRARAGYIHNLADVAETGIVTGGLGVSIWSTEMDLAYAAGAQSQAASLRLLFRF